ncbi:sulfatase family protein [Cyclobacterium marinum]|uniref:Sulfatase n=1 Tax=Cyclobacterium marinum (strain ATCC 25205 / DSM 745 / LMG 13164 / NCIMB 1802) TaxID=880070 RepID=G0J4C7_CYCMS|nr:sulfatase [Cyclobacterium marinum]AEL28367.1 sulfatase [Cyclobacterium marinum DSM 745]
MMIILNFLKKNTVSIGRFVICCSIVMFSVAGEVLGQVKAKRDKPNIVFLISEDNSKHFMKLFDPNGVETPNIEKMLQSGLLYPNAFSNAPVCSVARSTLISGTLTTRTGMYLHRKIKLAPMPEGLEMFPAYLRKAGYYTTNNYKKDYNAVENENVWDNSSNKATWQNRPEKNQPFFHQETFHESHESRLHFSNDVMANHKVTDDPAQVFLFPQFPNTPLFRYTVAYHRDKIREIDAWIGKKIDELAVSGELENTFIFYFGDHGGVLPGSKGYLFETGLNVPLVVRIPENYKHLSPYKPKEKPQAFVSFIDFAPTVLHLAGLEVPEQMDGSPFLGQGLKKANLESRDETYGHADRFDEKYEMLRSIRKGKWKYIRSYQPYYPDGLQNNYRYKMMAFASWKDLYKEGQLNTEQAAFFREKPVERLYNLEDDPYEINNLAGEEKEVLKELRDRLNTWMMEKNDLGFFPENILVNRALGDPVAFGIKHHDKIKQLIEIADWATEDWMKVKDNVLEMVQDGDELEKYWAYSVACTFGEEVEPDYHKFPDFKNEAVPIVQLSAITLSGRVGATNPMPALIEWLNQSKDPVANLIALNTLVYFKDHTLYGTNFNSDNLQLLAENEEVIRRLKYLDGTW